MQKLKLEHKYAFNGKRACNKIDRFELHGHWITLRPVNFLSTQQLNGHAQKLWNITAFMHIFAILPAFVCSFAFSFYFGRTEQKIQRNLEFEMNINLCTQAIWICSLFLWQTGKHGKQTIVGLRVVTVVVRPKVGNGILNGKLQKFCLFAPSNAWIFIWLFKHPVRRPWEIHTGWRTRSLLHIHIHIQTYIHPQAESCLQLPYPCLNPLLALLFP